jgi:hypothetical protein
MTDDDDDYGDDNEYNIACDVSISLIKSPLCIGRALLHGCMTVLTTVHTNMLRTFCLAASEDEKHRMMSLFCEGNS